MRVQIRMSPPGPPTVTVPRRAAISGLHHENLAPCADNGRLLPPYSG